MVRTFVDRHLPNESQHLFALTLVVGVVCGLVAVAFHLAIRGAEGLLIERAIRAPGGAWIAWTIVTPTLGGVCAGAALTWLVPGARGSGIPQVKQAFAVEGGRIKFRDAVGKFFVGALQIGSGASLGREGPTVQICAGTASLLAHATALPPRNMRRLTPVGVAAGIAAAFNAPIAAVTFTIEEIVGTLDQAVLSGVVVAAALAAVIERGILGVHPVIEVAQAYGLDHPSSLALYAALGVLAAIVSVAFTDGLLHLRRWFRGLRVLPPWMHPGVGGLVTGVLAVVLLRFLATSGVTGGGYETLGKALAGQLGVRVLLALCAVKLVATIFSYSSGGAGGIFAPALFVGAMLGGAVGHLDVFLLGHARTELGAFALVGMGAVFAGVIRAPITSVLIIFEMTGGYGLVLPLMLANMTCYILARRWRPHAIYEALLAQDGVVLPHAAPSPPHALDRLSVADAMTSDVVVVHPWHSVGEAAAIATGRPFACLPVVDEAGLVLGVVKVAELCAPGHDPERLVTELTRPPLVIPRDAPLLRAVVRMNDEGVRQLLVVAAGAAKRLVGVLAMSDLVRAHARAATAPVRRATTARPVAAPDLGARALMGAATVVTGATPIAELSARVRTSGPNAFVLRAPAGGFGVLLGEHLRDVARDEDLEKLLIAADLMRPASQVDEDADLAALMASMRDEHAEATVVVDAATREPVGVITKAALAMAVLAWYAGRPGQVAEARR